MVMLPLGEQSLDLRCVHRGVEARVRSERRIFGKPLFDQQNTRFVLAECRTLATVCRSADRITLAECLTSRPW